MGQRKRRKYDETFKQEAVDLVLKGKRKVAEAARDLGIPESALSRWLEKTRMNATADEQEEAPAVKIARLERENATLRMERDILKKAMGIVSKQ